MYKTETCKNNCLNGYQTFDKIVLKLFLSINYIKGRVLSEKDCAKNF